MPGMDMRENGDMSSMGPSMAAMAGHMYMTPLWPKQPGDVAKAKAVVAEAKATMERYEDYRKALLDGYVIANPKLKQPQYHFMNKANTREADLHFDPSKPTSLLYRRTPTQEYKPEGGRRPPSLWQSRQIAVTDATRNPLTKPLTFQCPLDFR